MHYFLPIFRWFEGSGIGNWVSDSSWMFPAIEAVHIVALTLLFGAILMLNLRLLDLVLTDKPIAQLAGHLAPWVFCSLVIILASGLLLFSSEAMKSYSSVPFQVKMVFLFAAILFHYTIYNRLTKTREGRIRPVWNKLAAVLSIALWLGVGIGGRAIGFL
jgi:cbb3-type cytochrome oxidase subunit 1